MGWCLAETQPSLSRRERAVIVGASLAPDLDGFGILPELLTRKANRPLFWWTDYHHVLCHNLTFAVMVAVVAGIVSKVHRIRCALFAFVAVHLHLLGDLAGSRGPDGYQWPIPYLYPFSDKPQLVWPGQWALNAWPNIALTVTLLAVTFCLAWYRGYSPLGLITNRGDRLFVAALRARVPR
jgi:hypothetical protein